MRQIGEHPKYMRLTPDDRATTCGNLVAQYRDRWILKPTDRQRHNQRQYRVDRLVVKMEMKQIRCVIALRRDGGEERLMAEATSEMQLDRTLVPELQPGWVFLEMVG